MRSRFRQGRRGPFARRIAAASGALALVLASAGAGTARADERTADPLTLGPIAPKPAAGPIRDRVIRSGKPQATAAASTKVYTDADGHSVNVRVSDQYSNPDQAAQQLVDLIGSFIHGPELNELSAFIATPSEIRLLCGAGALACYYPPQEEIVVSGNAADPNQPPRELVIAHEYGHHVANNRSNKPWSALGRGTKRWSSYEDICEGIEHDRINPGRYWENPGEAFAEAYAFYHYPNAIQWEWRIARPDQGAFDAIFADVTQPWTRRTQVPSSGTLSQQNQRFATRLETPLDGTLKVSLNGPSNADFDLRVLAPRSNDVLASSTRNGADERLRYTVCGRRTVKLAVKRESGSGQFRLKAARP